MPACSLWGQSSSVLQKSRQSTKLIPGVQAGKLTSLADEEEEPHAPGEIDQERHGISGIPQQINDSKESTTELCSLASSP